MGQGTATGWARRFLATAACVVAAQTSLVGAAPPPAAPPVWPCAHFAASPDFASDHTAFCAGRVVDRATGGTTAIAVWRTTDGGRSWTRAAATGVLIANADARVQHLSVSQTYKTDRAVFLQVSGTGLFTSVDGGGTFTAASPLAWGSLTTYAAAAGDVPGAAHSLVLMARPADEDGKPNNSAIIDPLSRAYTPVVGTPGRDRTFAVSDTYGRDGAAFAVADLGIGLTSRVALYRCNATFTCSDAVHTFPNSWTFDRIWLSPDFVRSRTVYVSMRTVTGARSLWWSRDAGKTWQRWAAAERLLAPLVRAKVTPAFALAMARKQVYLRVAGANSPRNGPPTEQLYRSTDNGATWGLVAFGRNSRQAGPRGTMPTDAAPSDFGRGDAAPGLLTATSDGHVFLLGWTWRYDGFYCSANAGRTWARLCAR